MTRHSLLTTRMLILAFGILTAAVGSFAALHGLPRSGGAPSSSIATVAAARGDILSTVGGLGRVVVARQATQVTAPSGTPASTSPSGAPSSGGQTSAPSGAVFATAAGHIAQYLVSPGERVAAGQPIALLDDGGTSSAAGQQARSDVASARLELAQKQLSDPAKGLPPTPAELAAARFAITAARERFGQLVHPTRTDVLTARLDIHKGMADLATLTRNPPSIAMTAAQSAIDAVAQKLAQISGPPTQAEVTSVRLELAKAQADLDALKAVPPGVSPTALGAAQLAVTLAQRKLVEVPATAPPSEKLQAQLDVAKAQADLEALQKQAPAASTSALAAAQTAVDLAAQRLAQLTGPPNAAAIATSQAELKKAQADLEALLRRPLPAAVDAAKLAISLAKQKLTQVLHPTRSARDAIRLDLATARAALVTLRHRGAPASPNDIGIAHLKVDAAEARLALADSQAARLTVRAPVAGTVTALLSSPGSPTDVTTPIATVADLQHLAVSVDLSEFDVARVRQGLPALVSVDALGGKHLPGTVEFTAFTGVDNGGVVTFPVRVAMRAAAGVRPGMNVSVKIVTQERRHVVTVPLEAVQHNGGRPIVTVVGRNGKTATRVVRLGLADNKTIEIKSGLRSGERVEIGGVQSGP